MHSDKSEKEKFTRILFGNKSDRVKDDPECRQVSENEIHERIEEINEENSENPIIYFEGSALDKTNIKETFDVFLLFLKEKYLNETKKQNEKVEENFKLNNDKKDESKKKKCC